MPADRQGRRAQFLFGFSTVRNSRSGGRGKVFSVGLHPSRQRSWYVRQRVGRASALTFFEIIFRCSTFPERGTRGGVWADLYNRQRCSWHASQWVRRASALNDFFFYFHCLHFPEWGLGVGFPEDLYNRRWRFQYAHQRVGSASVFFFFWLFHRSNFPEQETRGRVFGGSLQSAAALLVCMPASRFGERVKLAFYLSFRRSIFRSGRRVEGKVLDGSLVSSAALLVCTPAGREGERVINVYIDFRGWNVSEQRAGCKVFAGSIQLVTVFLVYMPAGRLYERAKLCFYF